VQYLGHKVSTSGIQPLPEYVTAVRDAPAPTNVKELQSFLGKVNFYDRFIPDRASILAPLYALLVQGATWNWDAKCQLAFQRIKNILASDKVLVHYSLDKPLILSVDAGPDGVGAVLAHDMGNGAERPIAYAS